MAQMTALRRRIIDDMTVRNLSPATQQSYVYAVAKFSRFFGCSPDRLGFARLPRAATHRRPKPLHNGVPLWTETACRFHPKPPAGLNRNRLSETPKFAHVPQWYIPVVHFTPWISLLYRDLLRDPSSHIGGLCRSTILSSLADALRDLGSSPYLARWNDSSPETSMMNWFSVYSCMPRRVPR